MLAPISGCVVSVAGILEARHDMRFTPAGSQSDTCIYTATLLTFAKSHKDLLVLRMQETQLTENWVCIFLHLNSLLTGGQLLNQTEATQDIMKKGQQMVFSINHHYTLHSYIYASMLAAYLAMGGLTNVRNSEAVRKQGWLSQMRSSEESAARTRKICQVPCRLDAQTHSLTPQNRIRLTYGAVQSSGRVRNTQEANGIKKKL